MSYVQYLLIFFLILLNTFSGWAQKKMVELDGIKYRVFHNDVSGRKKDQPALIFENGWGADLDNWAPILEEIGKSQIVFAYDRSGVGESEYNEMTPTLKNTAGTLRRLLELENIAPPYILIGHSLGGVYARGFTGIYPDEVKAVVFVDPADFTESKEDWKEPFRKVGIPEKKIEEILYDRLYAEKVDEKMPPALWQELEVLKGWRKVDFAELRDLPLPRIPVYFFVGGRFDVPPELRSKDMDQEALFGFRKHQWNRHFTEVIDRSGGEGALIYVPTAGHFVHRDAPRIFIDNLLSLANR